MRIKILEYGGKLNSFLFSRSKDRLKQFFSGFTGSTGHYGLYGPGLRDLTGYGLYGPTGLTGRLRDYGPYGPWGPLLESEPWPLSCTFWSLTSFRTKKILESLWKLNLLWGRGVFTVLLEFQAGSGVTLLTFVPLVTLAALVTLVALVALAMRAILARKLGAFALISLRARYGLGFHAAWRRG